MLTLRQFTCALACVVGTWCSPASALEITYQAVDIDDNGSVVDRWRYDYILSGPLAKGEGVKLLFDFDTRDELEIVTFPDDQLLVAFAEDPDGLLEVDGVVSLTANRAIADEQVTFSVAFDKSAVGTPGAQRYELIDSSFNVVSSAFTTAVPEPATASLMLAALALMAPVVRRRLAGKG